MYTMQILRNKKRVRNKIYVFYEARNTKKKKLKKCVPVLKRSVILNYIFDDEYNIIMM